MFYGIRGFSIYIETNFKYSAIHKRMGNIRNQKCNALTANIRNYKFRCDADLEEKLCSS